MKYLPTWAVDGREVVPLGWPARFADAALARDHVLRGRDRDPVDVLRAELEAAAFFCAASTLERPTNDWKATLNRWREIVVGRVQLGDEREAGSLTSGAGFSAA